MAAITTRAGKTSPLTHNEVDANFTNLNSDKLDTAGIALGSAASPAIKFTGDTNTGIYSPGANQLAVSTGGTGRLFVASDGNVGIGTSSPSSLLHLVSSGQPTITVADDSGRTLQIKAPSSTLPCFLGTTTNHDLLLQAGIAAEGLNVIRFNTAGAERVRIDSNGRVGIGTSSPSASLEVRASPDTVGTTNGIQSNIASPGLTAAQINSTTIGIGITGQATNFAGDFHLRSFWGFSIDKGAGNLSSGAGNSVNADSRTFAIRQFAGGTTWNTQFCVNGSGNVGIGTTSPTTLLDVNANTVRVRTARTPASASDPGATGEICWDANYIYVCTATNTWKRSALSTW